MAVVQSPKKVCVVCGSDVANKPRVKDAQGRYVCQGACQTAYAGSMEPKSTRAAPPVTAESSVLDNLISSSPMLRAKNCPSCNSPMPSDGVLCTRCGFNSQTGTALKTRVVVEKQSKQKEPKGGYSNPYAQSTGPSAWLVFGIAAGLMLLLMLSPIVVTEMYLPALGVFLVAALTSFVMTCSSLYRDGNPLMIGLFIGARIAQRFLLKTGSSAGLWIAGIELLVVLYVLFCTEDRWTKVALGTTFVGVFGMAITLLATGGPPGF